MSHKPVVWTALVTPLLENGKIDYPALEGLLHRQKAAGNGVVLCGSTGEGIALSDAEKSQLVSHVCSLGLKIPLLIGVGGFNLDHTKRWLEFCETQPIDGYLMVTPPYSKPGVKGQIAWFRDLMDT